MTDETINVPSSVEDSDAPRSNRTLVWVLIILATIVMVLSTLNAWLERQLLNTDAWVDASSALLDDDDIRRQLSVQVVDALYENVDVGPAIDEQLPPELRGLGGPLAGVLRSPLVDSAGTLLGSEPVRVAWEEANRSAHTAVVAILEDDVSDNISTADGKVVIDLSAVVRQVGEQVGLPEAALDEIPEGAGMFEVIESEELETVQAAVSAIKILSAFLFLLVIALYVGAIYLAHNWRREAVRSVGFAIALGGLFVLIGLRLGIGVIADLSDTAGGRSAADSILSIGTILLRRAAWAEVLIGLLIALGAVLLGPSQFAKRVRQYAAIAFQRSPVATWVGLAVVILILLAWSPISVSGNWLAVLIVVGLVVGGVEAIRRMSLAEYPQAPAGVDRAPDAATVESTAGTK